MLLIATYTTYEMIRWWLPILSFGGIVIKAYLSAKKSVGEWANKLFDNHLTHIEQATKNTEAETRVSNQLLKDVSGQNIMVLNTMNEYHEKQLVIWDGIVKTLAILEDRTRVQVRAARARKK